MANAEDRLAALFSEDRPAEIDIAFRLAVMKRLEHRRFLLDLAWLVPSALAAGAALWGLWIALAPALTRGFDAIEPALAVGAIVAVLAFWLLGREPHPNMTKISPEPTHP